MDFIARRRQIERPWCLHLSYIKPHWPYIAPAPYHAHLWRRPTCRRRCATRPSGRDPHPVYRAFMEHAYPARFRATRCARAVIPAYMGLITQIDDQLGRLFAFLEERGPDATTR